MSKAFWTPQELEAAFRAKFEACISLMLLKNSDYGNSWYDDRPTTTTDTIRHKVDRIRQIEEKAALGEAPKVSEGIESELEDIINYAVFRSIQLHETGK